MSRTDDEQREINYIIDRIDQFRVEKCLSQQQLAKEAGISINTIQYVYKRKSFPDIATLMHLCEAFDISLWQFFMYQSDTMDLTVDELEFLALYQKISFTSRKALLEIMKVLR